MNSSILVTVDENDQIVTDMNPPRIIELDSQYDLPEYVKQASLQAPGVAGTFIDKHKRLYPAGTKAACYLSYLDYLQDRPRYSAATQVIYDSEFAKLAKKVYHIVDDLKEAQIKSAGLLQRQIDELPDDYFAYIDGNERLYMLRHAPEIKAACAWFMQYRDLYPYEERRKIATRIADRAYETGAALDDASWRALEISAGRAVCDPAVLRFQLAKRAELAQNSQDLRKKAAAVTIRQAHDALLDVDVCEEDSHEALLKLAALLDDIDRKNGWTAYYDSDSTALRLLRPEETVGSISYKEAEAAKADTLVTPNGYLYNAAAIRNLPQEKRAGILRATNDSAISLPSAATICHLLKTATAETALNLRDSLAKVGIEPYAKVAVAPEQMSRQAWAELA